MTSHDQIAGMVTRASYRALLGRAPEDGVMFTDIPSPLSADQELGIEAIIRQISQSDEFIARRPSKREFGSETWVMATILGDLKIWLDLGDMGVCQPALREEYEPVETSFIDSILRPGLHFADIGANIGWFALRAARAVGPTGKVIAFEPRQQTAAHMRMSVEANGFQDRMVVHEVALGHEAGESFIGYGADGVNAGGTWSLPNAALVNAYKASGSIVQATKVARFDDVVGETRIDAIKIDIEGAEMMALRGATGVIARDKPVILCEINPAATVAVSQSTADDLVNLIRSFGYDGFYLTTTGTGDKIGANVVVPPGLDMTNVVFKPA